MLSVDLWGSLEIGIIKLIRPCIYVYRFSNNELRWFLVSDAGLLLESVGNELWDHCFPFLAKAPDGLLSISNPCEEIETRLRLLWWPFSQNYTHFMFDAFAPLIVAKLRLAEATLANLALPIAAECPRWQLELIEKLEMPCSRTYIDRLLPPKNKLHRIRLDELYLPLVPNKGISFSILKDWLDSAKGSFMPKHRHVGQILFATRADNRRCRVKNILEIEAFVRQIGGSVLDPATLTFSEKLMLFNGASHVIGESAGALNGALFAPHTCHIVHLLDSSIIDKQEFVPGGFAYHLGYAYRSTYILGQNCTPFPGSPLGSADYPLPEIFRAINH
ncbi:glycosyltransferase 61 family protein [Cyanobium sp. HWJ4-Hawea]|uniref:glycosyltransferase 61 family protein n=1 Tax=Cyanobium sp. HWJ4-Hawea TaxID=2823713 RepID=UPI0020CB76CF|nr:glycosyltransferase family 61 protein [Cyanobium sp. HWJ4-Hawea]